MYAFSSLLGLSLWLSCSRATNIFDIRQKGGRFSLEAVKIPNRQPVVVERGVIDEVDIGSNWYIPMEIGTPPVTYLLLGDSGAAGMAIESVFLPANQTGGGPLYDPSKSNTSQEMQGYTYENCYASGHCGHGLVYKDLVTVAANLTVTMAFEVSTGNNDQTKGTGPRSGNLGLNFDKNGQAAKPENIPSFFQAIMPQLENAVFTLDYDNNTSNGTWDFGFVDENKYIGEIGYTPVAASGGEWSFIYSGYQVGQNGTFNATSWLAIVDSGTGGSAVPQFVVDGFFKDIKGATWNEDQKTYDYPCSTALPDFVFGVNGSDYRGTIPGSYLEGSQSGSKNMCTSKLIAGNGTVIFGQNWIEAQFIVYDWGNSRVGFANKNLNATIPQISASSSSPTTTSSASGTSTVAPTSTVKSLASSVKLSGGWFSLAMAVIATTFLKFL